MFSRLLRTDSFRKITSILLSLFLALISSSAQEVLKIDSIEQANEQFENFIFIYVDTTNTLDLQQIMIRKEQNLLLPLKQFKEKRTSKYAYWLYLSIINTSESKIPLGLAIPKQNHIVDIYGFADNIYLTQKSGFYVDGNKNDEIILSSNIIPIRNAKKVVFYLKIKNINDQLPDFSVKLVNLNKAIKLNNRSIIIDSIQQGMMWLMIIYGLFLYFLKKDILYLCYSLYILITVAFYFVRVGYCYRLFPGFPREIFPYSQVCGFLGFLFYVQFLRLFLDTPKILPKWDKLFKIIQILIVIEVVRNFVFAAVTKQVILNFRLGNVMLLTLAISGIIIAIKLLSIKSKLANIIAFGSLLLISGFILGTIRFAFFNATEFTYFKIGTISELLIFTFGISYRYNLIEGEKQKFQKQLIVQLEENAELHQKVNRELADKVKERTIELEQQRDIVISQKDHIEKINTEITDSIRYAKYIQSSILPKQEQLESFLGEHFILYKPKDIVSGDFYWTSRIENKTIIAAADCTGHGVPGAFMSMLGTALLNEIVNKEYITHPGVILRRLRKEVINSLQQKGERGEQKDGMDIALCSLDLENMKLQFAGANNPLYLVRKSNLDKAGELRCELPGDGRLYEIKGDMMPIGIYDRMENFTLHEIDIYEGDSIYLFSDGFPDQFGGPDKKKFGYRQFREHLLKYSPATMADQKKMLEKSLTEWIGDNNQIDDILVIGFRVG